jgi:hypothetical protein
VVHQTRHIEWSAREEQLFDASLARIVDAVREHKRVWEGAGEGQGKGCVMCAVSIYGVYIQDILIFLSD